MKLSLHAASAGHGGTSAPARFLSNVDKADPAQESACDLHSLVHKCIHKLE